MIEMSENIKSNAKRFWTFCRLKTKSRLMPAVLSSGNEEAICSDDKSFMFNNYLHSVFNNDTSDTNLPEVNVHMNSNLSNIVFSENDVFQVLKKLDINKGSGPNDVPLRVLHQCAAELTPSLTALFNMSMSTCALPDSCCTLLLYQYIKKEINVKLTIIDPFHCLMVLAKLWSDLFLTMFILLFTR